MVLAGIYERRNRRRAHAEGRAKGREEGRAKGREEGRAEGREEARAEGYVEARAEGYVEGRAEGRVEANNAWRDWLRRKEAAAERGETFNEPMPDDGDENGGQAQPMPPKERLRS